MKKAHIIHGWTGYPENNWFPWLKKKLEEIGYQVTIPSMPTPEAPKIETWVGKLKEVVEPGEDSILIGHSMGCQTILRYLETLDDEKFKAVYLVAGFVYLTDAAYEDENDEKIAGPWNNTPLNWEKIKKHSDKFIAIFCEEDPVVEVANSKYFKEKLGAKIIIEHNKGHFDDAANVRELPVLLEEVKKSIGIRYIYISPSCFLFPRGCGLAW